MGWVESFVETLILIPHIFYILGDQPLEFQDNIFWYLTLFFFFLVIFCWEEREGVAGFRPRERKWLLGKILATKMVDFCVKKFYMMRGLRLGDFVYLKNT